MGKLVIKTTNQDENFPRWMGLAVAGWCRKDTGPYPPEISSNENKPVVMGMKLKPTNRKFRVVRIGFCDTFS